MAHKVAVGLLPLMIRTTASFPKRIQTVVSLTKAARIVMALA